MTSTETDTEDYVEATLTERLERLRNEWRHADNDRHKAIVEGRMMELTITMDDHPDEHDNVCLCADCRSCG